MDNSVEPSVSGRYYDQRHLRLVYVGKSATPEMWDHLWTANENEVEHALRPGRGTRWVVRLTERYLPDRGRKILEGGCGPGHNVAALRRAGYDCMGVDFAPETLLKIKKLAPDFPIVLGDLRSLPFDEQSFDAYWSLGVIEHFYRGYGALANEMARVIRPGGYLFLTFPYMSPLRRAKAALGQYPAMHASEHEPIDFYQFALDASSVIDEFARLGFVKRHQSSMTGLKGCKDEIGILGRPLDALESYTGRFLPLRGLRFIMEGLAWLGAGHTCVLVFQKSLL